MEELAREKKKNRDKKKNGFNEHLYWT